MSSAVVTAFRFHHIFQPAAGAPVVASRAIVYRGGARGLLSRLQSSVSSVISGLSTLAAALTNLARTGGGDSGSLAGIPFPMHLLILGLIASSIGVMTRFVWLPRRRVVESE